MKILGSHTGRVLSRWAALGAGLASLLLIAAPAGADAKTYVASHCNNAAFKPKMIVLTCGDAGLAATQLKWSKWTDGSATGTGTGQQKLCEPNCAEGKTARAPMKVVLSKPKVCPQDGKRHFTRIAYTWTEKAPEGPRSGTIPLPCAMLES